MLALDLLLVDDLVHHDQLLVALMALGQVVLVSLLEVVNLDGVIADEAVVPNQVVGRINIVTGEGDLWFPLVDGGGGGLPLGRVNGLAELAGVGTDLDRVLRSGGLGSELEKEIEHSFFFSD